MDKINGLIAAPFTPMDEHGEVNFSHIQPYAAWLKRNNLKGVFINGTTGEGMSLTVSEREKVAEEWKKNSNDLLLFVQVAENSLKNAKNLANHAQEIGADAVATLPPLYYKPGSVKMLVRYCNEIAAAAPETPFYYYHIPSMSGVNFPMIEFVELAQKEIPTFSGLKFTSENLYDFGLCMNYDQNLNMLFGRDEMLLGGLATGAKGAIGSFYNFLGHFANKLLADYYFGKMEEADNKQQFIRDLTRIITKNGNSIATLKTIIRFCAIDCGPTRLPLQKLSETMEKELKMDLLKIGFFDRILK